ncbi:hypothetical protein IEO21_06050 [Rhodonia placenta]|uniref:Uncharacterized protein n=1 Tax=Rhodonia placenta TaxID=104341 RepID=A0A8H7P117_9APHY|nr:hypothetical protein IEO21_06050 [Postia placenta]
MLSNVVLPALFAASSVAPAMALPISAYGSFSFSLSFHPELDRVIFPDTDAGSEAISLKNVGKDVEHVAGSALSLAPTLLKLFLRDDDAGSEALHWNWTTIGHDAESVAGDALSFAPTVFKWFSHSAKEERRARARRELVGKLMARTILDELD